MIRLPLFRRFSRMPPTHSDNSEPKPVVLERTGFEEPTISDPMDLGKTGDRAPMMAMLSGSGGGGIDAGGFPPDGLGGDGFANLDGGGGPTSDGIALD